MSAVKKTVSINEEVAKEAGAINPDNFSATVETALIEYIHKHRAEKAIKSFGSWGFREEKSVDIINALRHNDDRQFVYPIDKKNKKKA
jgi:hypothetical protein